MRITNAEIEGAVELYVNCIYDDGLNSDWLKASLDEWKSAVYEELVTWKTDCNGSYWKSNVNRFEGKDAILTRITPIIVKRLNKLAVETGYDIVAIKKQGDSKSMARDTSTLDKLLAEFRAAEKVADEAAEKVADLRKKIEEEMKNAGVVKYEDDNNSAQLISKENISYTDEKAILAYLVEKNYSKYFSTTVVKKSLNEALKGETPLSKELAGKYEITPTQVLQIKTKK